MYVMYFMILGIAVMGGSFTHLRIFGISFTYITIAALFVSYFRFFIIKRGIITLDKKRKALVLFEIYAILMVCISLLSITKFFISDELYMQFSYIPRQAFYIAVMPSIILIQDEMYSKKLIMFLNKYSDYLFWIILVLHMVSMKAFAVSLTTIIFLAFLALYNGGNTRTIKNIIKFLIIIFIPIAVGGELTNLIIRCTYAFVFLYRKHEKTSIKILKIIFIGMLFSIFILPLFTPVFSDIFDVNSFWRLSFWQDELNQLLKSKLIGVGYGTSYATINFSGGLDVVGGPFGATVEYSTLDKLFVTGPHCSYIAIAFRTGVVGIVLFLFYIFSVIKGVEEKAKSIPLYVIYALFSSLFLIGFNVGLESPYYLMIFVFFIGLSAYCISTTIEKIA